MQGEVLVMAIEEEERVNAEVYFTEPDPARTWITGVPERSTGSPRF
jgi:hypothetical protein